MTMFQVFDKDGTLVAETNAEPIFSLDVDRMMIVAPWQGFKMLTTAPGKAPFTAKLASITWKLNSDLSDIQEGSLLTFARLEASVYGLEKS
jgi:hypothetical protein